MKYGLVLEGGAMRGLFTAGVLDVWMEHGITFDAAIGVSAGATFGCNYKSKQIGRVIRYNKTYAGDPRYCGIESLLKTGDLYNAEFCYHAIPDELDPMDRDTYLSNPMEFWCVATNAENGKAEYHRCDDVINEDLEWIRASASMPLVSRPVEIGEYSYLDGGISDSIPVSFFQSIGYEKNVVVLTQPEDYRKKPQKGMDMMRVALRKYPAIIKDLKERYIRYNMCLEQIALDEKAGKVLVIRPEQSLEIGKIEKNPDKMEEVYQIGRKIGLQNLENLKKFLQQEH